MFAFALYDGRGTQPLCLLARDRLGIKPLYYMAPPDSLAFASEVKALAGSGSAPGRKNPEALAGLLMFGSVPAPVTRSRGVDCLLPGHYLVARASGVTVRQYWEPDHTEPRASATGLREALADSVNRHLVSDVPVGVFLSGGVDSAALVALASRSRSPP